MIEIWHLDDGKVYLTNSLIYKNLNMFIVLIIIILIVIGVLSEPKSLAWKIMVLTWYTLWMFLLWFFLVIIFIDFAPVLSIISALIIFIFWIIKVINIFRPKKVEYIKSKNNDLTTKISNINIWWKNLTYFIFTNWKTIKIKSTNLAKICYKTIESHKKNTFLKNELLWEYNYFKENYKTSLDEETYNKVLVIVERFVKEWWTINIL